MSKEDETPLFKTLLVEVDLEGKVMVADAAPWTKRNGLDDGKGRDDLDAEE